MSEAATAARPAETKPQREAVQSRIAELKVSGHLMTLDTGLYCITAGGRAAAQTGLPGVRISQPPGESGRPHSVSVSTFRADGWVPAGDAGLVRISDGPAQILVTIYQAPDATAEQAPRLTVLPLSMEAGGAARPPGGARTVALAGSAPEIAAHIQRMGDVPGQIGEWIGTRGSRLWIEGFGIAPKNGIRPADIEYQAVLGKDWLSPWVEGGKFCGSRAMALPLLGLTVRLKGAAASANELSYSASFVDGTTVGPVGAGEPCQSESLAALEAFRVVVTPKAGARGGPTAAPARQASPRKQPTPPVAAPKKAPKRRG